MNKVRAHISGQGDAEQAHVYVYGDIYNEQSGYASEYGVVSMTTVLNQLNKFPDAKEIVVHIHTRGGDVVEGFAIHDMLVASGKKVITRIEGLCASIGTVIALAGTERYMNQNSDFFIHNPWGDPFGMDGYTADDYEKRAEEIRIAESKLIDFYVAKTGADKQTITDMMKQQTTLTADKALEMKFVTSIVETVNAFASLGIFKNKNNIDMKNKNAKAISALDKLVAFLKGESASAEINNLSMTLEDGTAIEVETEGGDVAVDDMVMVNGEPIADGEHILSDGRTIVTAGGKVTEVKPKEEAVEENPDTAALQAELEAARAENETLKAANAQLQSDINAVTNKIASVEALVKKTMSNYKPEGRSFERDNKKSADTIEARIAARKAEAAKK